MAAIFIPPAKRGAREASLTSHFMTPDPRDAAPYDFARANRPGTECGPAWLFFAGGEPTLAGL